MNIHSPTEDRVDTGAIIAVVSSPATVGTQVEIFGVEFEHIARVPARSGISKTRFSNELWKRLPTRNFIMDNDEEKPQAPPLSLLDRYRGRDFVPLYTTTVTVSGGEANHGRASGVVRSDDGNLAADLRLPTELGGCGNGTNPEQLFAAGFAACFHGALTLVGKRAGAKIDDTVVQAQVSFGRDPVDGGYAVVIDIHVRMPSVERSKAEELVQSAERMCPYIKMVRQGTTSLVTVVD